MHVIYTTSNIRIQKRSKPIKPLEIESQRVNKSSYKFLLKF